MDTDRWNAVKRVFGAALEVAPSQRLDWLEENCPDEPLRCEVLSLLREYEDSTQFLEKTPAGHAKAIEQALAIPHADQRIGPYRLVREVGRGGMGIVFEAVREGADFEQRVALKLIRAGFGNEHLDERFRYERRILARLDHPGIARLFDGGVTPNGAQYLVMEFVEGEPIDAWCDTHGLDERERVRLLLKVCAAVGYAHRNLVIHRDLKPRNVVVSSDGQPKLLDFGIAKLLSEDTQGTKELTRTDAYLLTPEYASPEQIQGTAVTTAADIYSFGVMLYHLLTGHRPHDLTGLPVLDAMRKVVETEPQPPSARAEPGRRHVLKGDLDNIILKCLSKDPQDRYASARAVAEDLEAWLRGDVVSATAPTWQYRFRKWVSRNKMEAAVIAALAISIIGGSLATAWQARQAHIARQKAESRFREVQTFSRSLLFEVHEAIRGLAGATPARELLLRRATEFLDGLARDAGDDAMLKMELAVGYRRLSNVLGSDMSENLGRKQDAIRVAEKALRLAREAAQSKPGEFEPLAVVDAALVDAALLYSDLDRPDDARRLAAELETVIRQIQQDHAHGNDRARAAAAVDLSQLAMIHTSLRQYERAMNLYQESLKTFDSLPLAVRDLERNMTQRAFAYKRLGGLLIRAGRLDEAEKSYTNAMKIDEKVMAGQPGNRRLIYDSTFSLSDLGLIEKQRKNYAGAANYYERVAAIRDEAYREDKDNRRVLYGAGSVHCNLGDVYRLAERFAEARNELAQCVHLRIEYAGKSDEGAACFLVPNAYLSFALALTDEAAKLPGPSRAGRASEARSMLQRSVETASRCRGSRKEYDADAAMIRDRIATLH